MAYMSQEGYDQLVAELKRLESVERPEISRQIAEARDKGDLSENAEYDAAKDEQRDIEARIEEIEKILKNAEVIDEDDFDHETVNFGSEVAVLDKELKEKFTYKIVGSTEADILKGKISNESPLGVALMKKKVGAKVVVEAPDGNFEYKIVDIKRS